MGVLVWNLAPRTGRDPGAPPPQKGTSQLQHCFQDAEGATLPDRWGCYWKKLVLYSVLGIGTGLLSHSLSMIALGKGVQLTTLGWVALIGALHLGASGNTRYQILCGVANVTAYGFNPMLWSSGQLGRAVTLHFTGVINDTVLVWNLAPRTGRDPGAPPPQKGTSQLQHCFQDAEGATLPDRWGCYWKKLVSIRSWASA